MEKCVSSNLFFFFFFKKKWKQNFYTLCKNFFFFFFFFFFEGVQEVFYSNNKARYLSNWQMSTNPCAPRAPPHTTHSEEVSPVLAHTDFFPCHTLRRLKHESETFGANFSVFFYFIFIYKLVESKKIKENRNSLLMPLHHLPQGKRSLCYNKVLLALQ
jgi:hypothetical protein